MEKTPKQRPWQNLSWLPCSEGGKRGYGRGVQPHHLHSYSSPRWALEATLASWKFLEPTRQPPTLACSAVHPEVPHTQRSLTNFRSETFLDDPTSNCSSSVNSLFSVLLVSAAVNTFSDSICMHAKSHSCV